MVRRRLRNIINNNNNKKLFKKRKLDFAYYYYYHHHNVPTSEISVREYDSSEHLFPCNDEYTFLYDITMRENIFSRAINTTYPNAKSIKRPKKSRAIFIRKSSSSACVEQAGGMVGG